MNKGFEMRFTGSGGQGIILASVIIAEAAVLSGKRAVQSQSYGPEARGGLCKAETILSEEYIYFGKVTDPDFLLALNQGSLDKYSEGLRDDADIMVDSSLKIPGSVNREKVISIPIIATAKDVVGKVMTANIVAVGAINAAYRLFDEDSLKKAVKMHVPAGTEELNYRALKEGYALIGKK